MFHILYDQLMKKNTSKNLAGWAISPPEVVFKSPVTDVESARVRCERTGKSSAFFRFAFPDWVNVIGITPELRMIVIRQFRFGSERMETEIPGGVMHEDESPVEAGCRELLEETGYAGENPRVIGKVCPNPALQANSCYTVLVEDVQRIADQAQDDMEDIEINTLPVSEVFEAVLNGRIRHGLVLNALMFYQEHTRQNESKD